MDADPDKAHESTKQQPVQGMLLDPKAVPAPPAPADPQTEGATPSETTGAAAIPPAAAESAGTPGQAPDAYGFTALTPAEARVLGCLIEKQLTTPEYYPLTLHALLAACNQKSNRAPAVEYDEKTVVRAVDSLRTKKLAWMVSTSGGRVPKYEHRAAERLLLDRPEQVAVLCELLLRGPQTVGELRSHAERMHAFGGLEAVQAAVEALGSRPVPLVLKLPRLPGHKESRWTHLLSGQPETAPMPASAEAPPEPVRAAVQADDVRLAKLEQDVATLQQEVAELKAALEVFRSQFG